MRDRVCYKQKHMQQPPSSAPPVAGDSVIRPAATVVVLRERESSLEVLLVKRAANMAFYAGAWVFPGGRIEPEDGDLARAPEDAARRAGARELYEEAGLTIAPHELVAFSRWITPPGRARRFDTFYFAARAPEAEVRIDPIELADYRWLSAPAALEARARGEIELPPPTFVTLSELVPMRTVAQAAQQLAARPFHYVPRQLNLDDEVVYLYEGDAGYETRDARAAGARHRLCSGTNGWRYERALADR
jgi:8-oxo-dGTP pyrophosphatase MutT (NUDIX family)